MSAEEKLAAVEQALAAWRSEWPNGGDLCAAIEGALDDEEFCSTCFAGMESSEHHEKCIAPLDQIKGGGA